MMRIVLWSWIPDKRCAPSRNDGSEAERMNRFAALLDRLAYEPSRNTKLRLLTEYFRARPIRTAATRSRRSPAR